MSSVSGDTYRCEQLLLNGMKNVKSRTMTRLTHKNLEGCMRTATTEINPNIERLMKSNVSDISLITNFVKENCGVIIVVMKSHEYLINYPYL
jgi:hypothetical protein